MSDYKLLLLSPYDGLSHRFWREGLTSYLADKAPNWHITPVGLPPRHFSWRQRGNSLSFARHPDLQQEYDLVIATSVTDLSALRGLNSALSGTPAIVYFHENQFVYPESHPERVLERQVTSIYTALSAQKVFFNSAFNLESFMAGSHELLSRMPDEVPDGVVQSIEQRASVLPVALSSVTDLESPVKEPGTPVRIVWNHRWEHDKGPALLQEIVKGLLANEVDFSMSMLGQQFRNSPAAFQQTATLLSDAGRLAACGYIEDRHDYLELLTEHDLVLSTAGQEFQGLAIQEAIQHGCTPVTPDALVYPEYVPDQLRFDSAEEAVQIISSPGTGPMIDVSLDDYMWPAIGPVWMETIEALVRQK